MRNAYKSQAFDSCEMNDCEEKLETQSGSVSRLSVGDLQKKPRFSIATIDLSNINGTNADSDNKAENELNEDREERSRADPESINQHTYNTLYLKSLRNYLTREALPDERHYRNQLSIRKKFLRPTLEELHHEQEKLDLLNKQVNQKIRNGVANL